MTKKFLEIYGENPPSASVSVECALPPESADLGFLKIIENFRPFGMGNPKPLWLFEDVTISRVDFIGAEKKHVKIYLMENPNLPILLWNGKDQSNILQK